MTTNESIAVWGCITSSSVWAAQERPMGWAFAGLWLAYAIAIIVMSRRKDTTRHEGARNG